MGFWSWLKTVRSGKPEPIPSAQAERVNELCTVLRELIALLDADGEAHWQHWMATSLAQLEDNDLRGARHLLGAYGGMGSFNDLIIGQRMDGDQFSLAKDANESNEILNQLRGRASFLAEELIVAGVAGSG